MGQRDPNLLHQPVVDRNHLQAARAGLPADAGQVQEDPVGAVDPLGVVLRLGIGLMATRVTSPRDQKRTAVICGEAAREQAARQATRASAFSAGSRADRKQAPTVVPMGLMVLAGCGCEGRLARPYSAPPAGRLRPRAAGAQPGGRASARASFQFFATLRT